MRWLALALCCTACGGSDDTGLFIALSSDVTPLDRATVTVLGERRAIVLDNEISDAGDLQIPREIRIDGGTRAEAVRILVWGERGGTRVAFGHVTARVQPGVRDDVDLKLAAAEPDCDGDGVPDTLDGCVAIADPAQEDGDGDGTTDACSPGAGCPANLVGNPGFEASTMGWQASTAAPTVLTRVPGGRTDDFAGELCKIASGAPSEYTMDDRPGWVATPTQGARYRADAWVRSTSPAAQQIDLRLGELDIPGNNPLPGTAIGSVQGSTTWQVLTATYAVTGIAGTTSLDLRLRVLDAADGACFQVDDICLQQLAATCP